MQVLWERVYLASKFRIAPEDSHWREAVRLQHMWQKILPVLEPEDPQEHPHGRETVPVHALPREVLWPQQPEKTPEETPPTHVDKQATNVITSLTDNRWLMTTCSSQSCEQNMRYSLCEHRRTQTTTFQRWHYPHGPFPQNCFISTSVRWLLYCFKAFNVTFNCRKRWVSLTVA